MVVAEALVFGKDPAAQQRDLHHAEVLWVRGQGHGVVLNAVTGRRAVPDSENSVALGP
jgi:hypothetical protein